MKKALLVLLLTTLSYGANWTGVLPPAEGFDWQNVGIPGGTPPRTTVCTTLTPSATYDQINSALSSCPSGQTVYLSAGTYTITSNINMVSNVTLRGAGAQKTIFNITGGTGYAINFGSSSPSSTGVNITSGANQGSTSIVLSTSGVSAGKYLLITELNNSSVSTTGNEGACTWCGPITPTRARGEIVEVASVSGTTATLSLPLAGTYTLTPQANLMAASLSYAGLEDLQIYANNTGHSANEGGSGCVYCWVKGVENNFTDGDQMDFDYTYRLDIEQNYMTGGYQHLPGSYDTDIDLRKGSSRFLVANNIDERGHVSFMQEWGVCCGVIAYNYSIGDFDSSAYNWTEVVYSMHGAHQQYILFEGNIGAHFEADNIWGSNSDITYFRNWGVGVTSIAQPLTGRGTIQWGTDYLSNEYVIDFAIDYEDLRFNLIGNVAGSKAQIGDGHTQYNTVTDPAARSTTNDFGYTWGCSPGAGSCSGTDTSTQPFSTASINGNYNLSDNSINWANGQVILPASFYLPSTPTWWNSRPFPNIGPDVTGSLDGGGHAYPNPAMDCYNNTSKITDGSLAFDRAACYGNVSVPSSPTGLTVIVK